MRNGGSLRKNGVDDALPTVLELLRAIGSSGSFNGLTHDRKQ